MPDIISLPQKRPDCINLLQFTDTHIYSNPDQTFDGVDTGQTLAQVIAHAQQNHWPPDAILVTGDLTHYAEPAAYQRLACMLESVAKPVFCIPGNHDDPYLMREILSTDNIYTVSSIVFDRWVVIMLDSYLPGTHAGRLSNTELEFLDWVLTEHADKYALICLHHPPVPVGSPWMDRMSLQNPDDLFSIVDRHAQVCGILWGHIHQEFNADRHGIKLMAAPSTCVQFQPCSNGYFRDDSPPGYRHLQLFVSGEIRTGVERTG